MNAEKIIQNLKYYHHAYVGEDNGLVPVCVLKEAIDLIRSLQDEKPKRKKILANRVYSDATLKSWKKEDLIEQIRILEHNWASAEESLANSVKNSEKIFYEQKAEIERLTEEANQDSITHNIDLCTENLSLRKQNAELQKQVDELKELNAKYLDSIESVQAGRCRFRCELTQQAVKDTAKEILQGFNKWLKQAISDSYEIAVINSGGFHGGRNRAFHEVKELVKKVADSNGVEVE